MVSAGRVKVVGQKLQPLAGFGIAIGDAAQFLWVRRGRLVRGKNYCLIRVHARALVYRVGGAAFEQDVAFAARHEEGKAAEQSLARESPAVSRTAVIPCIWSLMNMRILVTGGAGFLGSNLVNSILDRDLGTVTVYDNFLTGRREHFGPRLSDSRLKIVEGDVANYDTLAIAVAGHDVVFHLAANSDIARAANEPLVDSTMARG